MQEYGGGLGVGTDLTGGGSQGVGGLQGVPPLDALAAAVAAAHVDTELPDERLAGNLGLELIDDVGFDDVALAVGTGVGKRGIEAFVDVIGRRFHPIGMSAAVIGFATGRFGLGLGLAFAERSGLPLAGPLGLFQLPGQFDDLGFELGKAFPEFLAARTQWFLGAVHDRKVSETKKERKRALNKHQFS